jgi:hypothetical protein
MTKTNVLLATTVVGFALTLGSLSGNVTALAASQEDVQAPRGQYTERPRGQDLQAPRGQAPAASANETRAPRGQDTERPRGGDDERPRGEAR